MEAKVTKIDQIKLNALNNPKVCNVVNQAIELMKKNYVMVFDDSSEDINKVRQLAILTQGRGEARENRFITLRLCDSALRF